MSNATSTELVTCYRNVEVLGVINNFVGHLFVHFTSNLFQKKIKKKL